MTSGAKYKRSGKLRIGVSNGFSGNTWRTECMASLRNEAAKHPEIADLIIVDGQGDITKQVNDIQDLISQQVDAILCIPNSSTAVAPALARAMRANIPVIPFNLDVSGEQWCSYIGTDPFKKGVAWGAFMTEALGNKGKIVVLGGLPGNSGSAAVWAGAQTTLGKGIEVLAMKDAYWQEDRAKVVMADLIVAYPQIDGIFCDGGQDAAGAAKAMLAAGRKLVPDHRRRLQRHPQDLRAAPPGQSRSQAWPGLGADMGKHDRGAYGSQAPGRRGRSEEADHRADVDQQRQLQPVR